MEKAFIALYALLPGALCAQQPEQVAFTNQQVRLVDSYRNSGDYRAAERVLREWLPLEAAGSESRLMVQNSLADLLREEGRNAEARQLFNQIVDSPGVMPQQRLSALIGLASVDYSQGDWKTSIEEGNAALDIARRRQDTRSEAVIVRGLGRAWLSAGSAARAEPLLRRSLRMAEGDAAVAPLEVAVSLDAMAEYYRAGNKLALAEEAWSRAIAIERTAFGEVHPQVAFLMEMLASVYSERGESSLACDYATRAAEVMRQLFGEDSPAAATALANLAQVEQHAHALGSAAKYYETSLRVLRGLPDLRPTMRIVMQRYAGVLKALHRDREAKALETEIKTFRPD